MDLPDHVAANRIRWDDDAANWVAMGERAWALPPTQESWGVWAVPERQIGLLPADMSGLQALELGCGTGYVSAWMTRRGASVTAIDNAEQQLVTARRLAAEHGLDVIWLHGNAETVPRADASFDFAISEYGAAIWCDPYRWIPEAHRLLRPGGTLAFLGNHPLAFVCAPHDGSAVGEELVTPWFGMHRFDWRFVEIDPDGINFVLSTGDWFRLFDDTGFDVVDYRELQAPDPEAETTFFVPAAWAHRFPSEQVWKLRKRS